MSAGRLPRDPVLYEIYVRSFADSDGDGIGDLAGITQRLGHLADLGVDGLWLTPVFESPQHDFGYDVSNYLDIHQEYGALADMDRLISVAHSLGLAVILDIVIAHTSIEHPWFREFPDRYIWADRIPNNWLSVFGGPAWRQDDRTGRYYYHRFYPEQPNLNWTNPDVRREIHKVLQFWIDRGVDGFRLDSLDGLAVDPDLRDEPPSRPAGLEGREQDAWAEYWTLEHVYTCDLSQVLAELARITSVFDHTAFVVEADLPRARLADYTALADSSFVFDLIRAPMDGEALGRIVDGTGTGGNLAWALSNHDYPRLVSRWGRDLAGVAAVLLLTLPGWSFIYQGDEIGMVDGPVGDHTHDRSGRDAMRHPMQWDSEGGFTTGVPWLPMTDAADCNVRDQSRMPHSMLENYRQLIRLRRELRGPVVVEQAEPGLLSYRRGDALITLNLSPDEQKIPHGRVRYRSDGYKAPHPHGVVVPRSAVIQLREPNGPVPTSPTSRANEEGRRCVS
jgi:alpha-glucosidase